MSNFGTITTGVGLATGFDISGTVEQLMAIKGRSRERLQEQTDKLQAKQLALTDLSALLIQAQVSARSLAEEATFQKREVNSTSDLLTATKLSGADPTLGAYSFTPVQMAKANEYYGNAFYDPSDLIGAGEFSMRFGETVVPKTSLDMLNDGNGVRAGMVRISDKDGNTDIVDLRGVTTIEDAVDLLNSTTANVEFAATGDNFTVTDLSGGTGAMKISNVGNGDTATDLGLTGLTDTNGVIQGRDVFALYDDIQLSELNDGNGLKLDPQLADLAFHFDGSGNPYVDANGDPMANPYKNAYAYVDLNGAKTLGEVIDKIKETEFKTNTPKLDENGQGQLDDDGNLIMVKRKLGDVLDVDISADGDRLEFTSLLSAANDPNITIGNYGSMTDVMNGLGFDGEFTLAGGETNSGNRLAAGMGTVLLDSLNGGQGLGELGSINIGYVDENGEEIPQDNHSMIWLGEDSLKGVAGYKFTMTDDDGVTTDIDIDLADATSFADAITAINDGLTAAGFDVTAYDYMNGQGIRLQNTTNDTMEVFQNTATYDNLGDVPLSQLYGKDSQLLDFTTIPAGDDLLQFNQVIGATVNPDGTFTGGTSERSWYVTGLQGVNTLNELAEKINDETPDSYGITARVTDSGLEIVQEEGVEGVFWVSPTAPSPYTDPANPATYDGRNAAVRLGLAEWGGTGFTPAANSTDGKTFSSSDLLLDASGDPLTLADFGATMEVTPLALHSFDATGKPIGTPSLPTVTHSLIETADGFDKINDLRFTVAHADGSESIATVDLRNATGNDDAVQKINDALAAEGINITASVYDGGKGIQLANATGEAVTVEQREKTTDIGSLALAELFGADGDYLLDAWGTGGAQSYAAELGTFRIESYTESAGGTSISSADIDLAGATTLQDVVDAINAGAGSFAAASLTQDGFEIKLNSDESGYLRVSNLGVGPDPDELAKFGLTASSDALRSTSASLLLDADGNARSLDSFAGDWQSVTPLSFDATRTPIGYTLPAGETYTQVSAPAGITDLTKMGTVEFDLGNSNAQNSTFQVDFSSVTTMEQAAQLIQDEAISAGYEVTAQVNANGNGILLNNKTEVELGNVNLSQLTSPLDASSLDGNLGTLTFWTDTAIAGAGRDADENLLGGSFATAGNQLDVDLSGANSLYEVASTINAAFAGDANYVGASARVTETGLEITSGGMSDYLVVDTTLTAQHLGLATAGSYMTTDGMRYASKDLTDGKTTDQLTGNATTPFAARDIDGTYPVTLSAETVSASFSLGQATIASQPTRQLDAVTFTPGEVTSMEVDLSSAETLNDVISTINTAALANGLKLEARINDAATGFEIVDLDGDETRTLDLTSSPKLDGSGDPVLATLGTAEYTLAMRETSLSDLTGADKNSLAELGVLQMTFTDAFARPVKDLDGEAGTADDNVLTMPTTDISVNLADAKTLGDVIDTINQAFEDAGVDGRAKINASGDGLDIGLDDRHFGTLDIADVGGAGDDTSRRLGLFTDDGTGTYTANKDAIEEVYSTTNILWSETAFAATKLSSLVDVNGDPLDPANFDKIQVLYADDYSVAGGYVNPRDRFDVDLTSLSADATLGDLVDEINTQLAGNMDATASITPDGLQIALNSGSTESFLGVSYTSQTANDLGIAIPPPSTFYNTLDGATLYSSDLTDGATFNRPVYALDTTLDALGLTKDSEGNYQSGDMERQVVSSGFNLDDWKGGQGVEAGYFRIRTSAGDSGSIQVTEGMTVGEVMDSINSKFDSLEAVYSEDGAGFTIRMTGENGSNGTFTIEEGQNTTAADLGLIGNSQMQTFTNADGSTSAHYAMTASLNTKIELDATDTLTTLAEKINKANVGIEASIFNDGSNKPYRLQLISSVIGEAGNMVLSVGDGVGLDLTESVKAQNSRIIVGGGEGGGGMTITGKTNTFDNIIDGITVTINGTSTSPIAVNVTDEDGEMLVSLQSFVDNYNAFLDEQEKLTTWGLSETGDQEEEKGLLAGDSTARRFRKEIVDMMSSGFFGSETIHSTETIGLTFEEETGKMVLNTSKFMEAWENDRDGVLDFFISDDDYVKEKAVEEGTSMVEVRDNHLDPYLGFGDRMEALLEYLIGPVDSVWSQNNDALVQQGQRNIDRLNAMTERLNAEQTKMIMEFINMEESISMIQSNMTYVDQMKAIKAPSSE